MHNRRYFLIQHDRTGEDGRLITLDHFGAASAGTRQMGINESTSVCAFLCFAQYGFETGGAHKSIYFVRVGFLLDNVPDVIAGWRR